MSVLADRTIFDFVLAVFAIFVMPVLSITAGLRLDREAPGARTLARRYLQMMARGWAVVAVVAALWLGLGRSFAVLGLSWPPSGWDYAGFVLVGCGLLLLPLYLSRLSSVESDRLREALKSVTAVKIAPDSRAELVLFVAVSLTAGVWEELLYRGFLIWFFVPFTGAVGAAIISSIVFGAGHLYQGSARGAVTGGIGLALALLYLASGTLWWLMAVHAAVDLHGGFTAWRLKRIAAQRGML